MAEIARVQELERLLREFLQLLDRSPCRCCPNGEHDTPWGTLGRTRRALGMRTQQEAPEQSLRGFNRELGRGVLGAR